VTHKVPPAIPPSAAAASESREGRIDGDHDGSAEAAARPRLELSDAEAGGKLWRAQGRWTALDMAAPGAWAQLRRSLGSAPDKRVAGAERSEDAWDLRAVERLDHVGAQVLWNHWGRHLPAQLSADEAQRRVLGTIACFSSAAPVRQRPTWAERMDALGAWLLQIHSHARGLLTLLGQLMLDLGRLLRHPRTGPWRDVSGQLYNTGATALPITALVGFLIGVVLAYLLSRQLRQFGADAYIVDILGVAMVRAGRSGSAMTAQIGVMRVTEEIDAMRVMGIARGYRLVLPRVLALMLVLPLLSTWTTLWALIGGMLASDLTMNVSPAYFASALPAAVQAGNLALALGKSAVFGLLIALLAYHHGLRVAPNTESLGRGTTASVVSAITAVLSVDAVFAVMFRSVGI
jgi:phospholipid/cholesterol/gamma-HCH transport system permease protein